MRSAFLQGLLVAPGASSHPDVLAFNAAASAADLSPLAYALQHVRALPWATEVVVGVTSGAELDAVATAWNSVPAQLAPPTLASFDLDLIDPRTWR